MEDYRITYDESSGSYVTLATLVNEFTFTATALVSGNTYKFRVEARNRFGYSAYSQVISILCAAEPDKPAPPTTTVVSDQVVIKWTRPVENGTPIIKYNIKIRKADSTFTNELVGCDGSKQTIVSETQCTVPLATLTELPFNLVFGDAVAVKLTASNAYGESLESDVGSGATIQLVPDPPINLANNLLTTLDDRIGITWEDGPSNGGSQIIDYEVWYDQGLQTNQFVILHSAVT